MHTPLYQQQKNGKHSIKQREIAKKANLVLFLIFQGGGYVYLHICHGGGHVCLQFFHGGSHLCLHFAMTAAIMN